VPHHTIHYTPAGQEALARIDKTLDEFAYDMDVIVAKVFNNRLGERLIPGRTVITDVMVETTTMPVDFHLTCAAWATPERCADAEGLETTLREELAAYYESHFVDQLPKQDSHLNIVGLAA